MIFVKKLIASRKSWSRIVPLYRDAAVPRWLKIGTALLALLIVSPFDPFADIPGLGILDDLTLLSLLASAFVALAERGREQTIEGTIG